MTTVLKNNDIGNKEKLDELKSELTNSKKVYLNNQAQQDEELEKKSKKIRLQQEQLNHLQELYDELEGELADITGISHERDKRLNQLEGLLSDAHLMENEQKQEFDTTRQELEATRQELAATKQAFDTMMHEFEATTRQFDPIKQELKTTKQELKASRQEFEDKKQALKLVELRFASADHIFQILMRDRARYIKLHRSLGKGSSLRKKLFSLFENKTKRDLLNDKELIGQSGLFSPLYYLSTNPDVWQSGLDPLMHFCEYGWKEGRQPSENFDIGDYVKNNPGVSQEDINPLVHFIGENAPLLKDKELIEQSGLFSPSYYLSKYPDVMQSGLDPLMHFCVYGWKEGRQPSENFDIANYVKNNPVISKGNINPLVHYIEGGTTKNISYRIKSALTRYFKVNHKQTKRISQTGSYFYYKPELTNEIKKEISAFKESPLMSIIIPVFNVEKKWLEKAILSIENQWYENWEINIANDASNNLETIDYLDSLNNPKINIKFLKENSNISNASNEALTVANGCYIVLMDHGDEFTPDALYEVVRSINIDGAEFIYSDEDKLEMNGNFSTPHFKADFSPDMFLSQNYLSHLGVIKKSLIEKVGGWTLGVDGAQEYDLYLKVLEHTDRIVHIPKVLYHTRNIPESTAVESDNKYNAQEAGLKSLDNALKRRGISAKVENAKDPGTYRIKYDIKGEPLVSIIIPFKDMPELLEMCVNSILDKSTYQNYEIIGVSNNSGEPETFTVMEALKAKDKRVKFYEYNEPFNYSAINNYAVKLYAKGEHILLLNNDIKVITSEWIEELLMFSQRPDVGAVGAKLYYPDDTIQHAGIIIGIGKTAGHSHKRFPKSSSGYFSRLNITQNLSAVTAACLMVKKAVYDEVNGLNEKDLKVAFNDVDFCLRIREAGYLNVYTPYCEAYHYESLSRGYEDNPEKQARFNLEGNYLKSRHKDILEQGDPYYNRNLILSREDFQIKPINQDVSYKSKPKFKLAKKFKHEIIKNIALRPLHNKYACIFSHYDKDGIIDDYVINYLKALSVFADIVFVSTAETMPDTEINKIEPFCDQIIIKKNHGYDFGAWKTGLELSHIELSNYENLILCNDSVYGPFYDLEEILEEAMNKYDVFSMTDSYEIAHHLQSYFVVYSRTAFSHKLFKEFWDSFSIYEDKNSLIKENEVKFSGSLIDSDLSVSAHCKAEDGDNLNQLHFYWDKLILNKKYPFIKIELLRDNPRNIDIKNWKNTINQTGYDLKLIEHHLKRML